MQVPTLDDSESAKIMLLDLKTRALTQVGGSQGICCLHWSPDGRYVVAVSGTDKLMPLDLSTQQWRQEANKHGSFGYMTQSPDRRNIGVDTRFTTERGLSRVMV